MANNEISDFSIREKNLWVELLVDGVIALYYFPKLYWLLFRGDEALRGGAMVNLVVGTVTVAIFAHAALAAFIHARQTPEPMDERDQEIERRAHGIYGNALQGCIVALIAVIAVQQMPGWHYVPEVLMPLLSPLGIANILLVMLMIVSAVRNATKVILYRRGA